MWEASIQIKRHLLEQHTYRTSTICALKVIAMLCHISANYKVQQIIENTVNWSYLCLKQYLYLHSYINFEGCFSTFHLIAQMIPVQCVVRRMSIQFNVCDKFLLTLLKALGTWHSDILIPCTYCTGSMCGTTSCRPL